MFKKNASDQVAPDKIRTLNELMVSMNFARMSLVRDSSNNNSESQSNELFESASNHEVNPNEGRLGGRNHDSNNEEMKNEFDLLHDIPLDSEHHKKRRLLKWIDTSESSPLNELQPIKRDMSSINDISRVIRTSLSETKLKKSLSALSARVPQDSPQSNPTTTPKDNLVPNKNNTTSKIMTPKTVKSVNNNNDEETNALDDWDPIKNEFDSIKNIYGLDEQKPEARLYGYSMSQR